MFRRDLITSPLHGPAPPVAMPHITPGLTGNHVLTVSSFTKDQLHQLFNLAHHIRASVQRERPLDYILRVSHHIRASVQRDRPLDYILRVSHHIQKNKSDQGLPFSYLASIF